MSFKVFIYCCLFLLFVKNNIFLFSLYVFCRCFSLCSCFCHCVVILSFLLCIYTVFLLSSCDDWPLSTVILCIFVGHFADTPTESLGSFSNPCITVRQDFITLETLWYLFTLWGRSAACIWQTNTTSCQMILQQQFGSTFFFQPPHCCCAESHCRAILGVNMA